MASVGLCMIVRDEASVIDRCLASVLPLIDHWTICDTGSADGTQELIARTLANVPGELHQRPWHDFGRNRTELMALARGTADYLLLLDADMTLHQSAQLPQLHADAYFVRHAGDLEYWVPRLVRGDRAWRFEGVTHEYLATDGDHTQERLDQLVVEHHADGGTRHEKFERDRRLLTAHLADHPDDDRTTFYLAQTLRDLGDDAGAVELYLRRAELGGWDEEAYYAAFQAGALRGRTDPSGGIELLRRAAELRPSRGEALHELARLARLSGRYEEAHAAAARGAELPLPADRLFVHRDVHEWGLRFEQSVAAYWIGRPGEALELTDALLDEARLPYEIEEALRENRGYCAAALQDGERPWPAPPLQALAPSFVGGEIALEADPPWPQFNPTIAGDGDGYRAVVRTANYRILDGGYEIADDDHVVRTINYLLRLDRSLAVTAVDPLGEPADAPPLYPSRVEGFEDLRLVEVGGRWFATGTVRDRHPRDMCRTALLELGSDGAVVRARLLPAPDETRDEKNWMPFVCDGALFLVYSVAPTVVYACDVETATVRTVAEHPAPAWTRPLRGGSQGVAVDGGRLFAVHEVLDESPRVYAHRFVLLDAAHRLRACSPRFTFAGANIEICLGLAARGDDELVLTYGVDDAAAWIGVVRTSEVLAALMAVT